MHYAKTAAPAHVFPIDTFVTSDSPLESKRMAYARFGGGPVLRAFDESGLTPTAEVARIAALARQHKIPLQLGVTAGGNDGFGLPLAAHSERAYRLSPCATRTRQWRPPTCATPKR